MECPHRPAWAEINLANLRHNLSMFRSHLSPGTKIMAVVKAEAYGHGALEVARTALEQGADYLAVALVEEGIALRKAGILAPILVFSLVPDAFIPSLFDFSLIPSVFTPHLAEKLSQEARRRAREIPVHVKVDTGMGRLGMFPAEATLQFLRILTNLPGLKVEGIYTHFATADEQDKTFAREQLYRFKTLLRTLEEKGICPPVKHAANSAAALEMPESWLDMVRLGISMYGHYPSEEVDKSILPLKPLLTLKSRVAYLKEVPAGTPVSYGCTYTTKEMCRIATIPLGYADGYSRLLSNKGSVLIGGRRAPVAGRVCMDSFLVTVDPSVEAAEGDEVVLYGYQGDNFIRVEEIARYLGTINYEVLCAIGKRVPRVYLNR